MIKFYEDFVIGEETILGSHVFTREEIIAYAGLYDPQPFHLEDAAGEASLFGGLCASGWHNCCVVMRKIVDTRARERAEHVAKGGTLPALGVSPGVTNLRWPNPTRPGDIVSYRSLVTSKRETKRPQWGLVGLRTSGVNQHGAEALSMDSLVFVARKGY